ncbi:MAG: WbqC family protein [Chromatiales bacterium]|nr:WbqC family protein [Chromatiales bacterium]
MVILQPMYFPWSGLIEQYRLCNTFVYYDDAQYSKGGFTNRVQIKTMQGIRWLTVPLRDLRLGQRINQVEIDNRIDWKRRQIDQLRQAYAKAPYREDMLDLISGLFKNDYYIIGDLAQKSTEALISYFPSIKNNTITLLSSHMKIQGASTQKVIDLCSTLNAKKYLTGHGARHYLEHEKFEAQGIDVAYIDYSLSEYPQLHGPFTPYVSALDLIANCGPEAVNYIKGQAIDWRSFLSKHNDSSQAKK